jgi:hypothetical protein
MNMHPFQMYYSDTILKELVVLDRSYKIKVVIPPVLQTFPYLR